MLVLSCHPCSPSESLDPLHKEQLHKHLQCRDSAKVKAAGLLSPKMQCDFTFLKKYIYLFIFGCVESSLLRVGFLVAASRGYSSLWWAGFLWRWLLLLRSTGSRCTGFSRCGSRAQQLWLVGLVALRHVGSSRTRAQTRVPCIGRQILNHCATREVPLCDF